MVADKWLAHQLAQDGRLQTKLEVTGDLFERVPDVILVFEQLRMSRVFEVKKVGGRKHESICETMSESFASRERKFHACCPRSRIKPYHAARVFGRLSYRVLPILARKFDRAVRRFSSNSFRVACSRAASASCATSAGIASSVSGSRLRTVLIRFHQSSHALADAASSLLSSIARFVSRIDSNRNPSAAEMFRSSSSASSNFCVGCWMLRTSDRWTFASCGFPLSRVSHSSIRPNDSRASFIPSQVKLSGTR